MKTCKKLLHQYENSLKQCPYCQKAVNAANVERRRAYNKKYREDNLERLKSAGKAWHKANRESAAARVKEWRRENRDRLKQYSQDYRANNRDKLLQRSKSWRKANPDHIAQYKKKYESGRKAVDPLYKLTVNLRNSILSAMKRKGYTKTSRSHKILGASFTDVHTHLILSALRNYGVWIEGYKYQIDHIVPVSAASTEQELIKLNHYTNLQYLYPHDNLSKGNSLGWGLT